MSRKDTQSELTPRLRFPEFQDAGPWEVTRLAEVVQQKAGNSKLIKGKLYSEARPGRFPGFSASGQDVWLDEFEQSGKAIIVSAVGARCGRCFLADGKWSAIANTHILFPDPRRIDILFLFATVTRDGFWVISGSGQPFVKVRDSLEQPVPLPSLEEEKKIADCLGSLDDLIAAEGRKLEALRDHKKGLMQQLFPREGESRPRLRFPEFADAGEWVAQSIGEFGDISMCKRILAHQTNDRDGVPFFKIGTLGATPDAYISRERYEEYRRRYSFPRLGEVLITCAGTVGKCVPYDGEDAYYQDSNIVWIENPETVVSNQFLFVVLTNVDWSKLNSTTITRIYLDDLRNLRIKVPRVNAEQQHIVDCLSSLDELIAAQSDKLDALRTHKRGLMQQLFPAPDVKAWGHR
jgi:type I restriction enzyme S subunit